MSDHIDALVLDYPRLLENVYCGIRYGVGWDPLIRDLCAKLTTLYPEVRCAQIKEKFGGLRFYVDNASDEARRLIAAAEDMSFRVCETCGAPGYPRRGGWIETMCDTCALVRGKVG